MTRAGSKTTQPSDQKSLYANMMEEVNARLETIFMASNGKYQMHEMLAEKLCYFQLRMTCETIACACLIAHGDLTVDVSQLHNEWSADRIFKKLDKLHSYFYPKPRIVAFNHKMQRIDITHKTEGFLTKNDFF